MFTGIKNKVAIVTGAGTGIGYAIAKLLLENEAKVVINEIDKTIVESLYNELNSQFPGQTVLQLGDAGEIEVIDQLISAAMENFGAIDFVIPNAGITLFGDFFKFKPEDFQKVIQLNLQGAFFLVQKASEIMIAQNKGGRIVLMSSITGIKGYPDLTCYSMTKAALRMMTKSLVLVLGPHEITINCIAPGATLTERTKNEEPDYAGTWAKLIPRGKVGTPDDMAQTCLFLLSKEASHINGQTIVVDGGWTAIGRYPNDLQE